jgi:Flp pilus assembly protein TadB
MSIPDPRGTGPAVPVTPRTTDTVAEERAATTGLGELLSDVSRDLSQLIRQEVELAKAEVTDSAKKAGKGAGFLGGAAVAGYFALLFLSICIWWALGYLIGNAWSALIVAVIYGIVAAVLARRGRTDLKQVNGLPQTAETVKEIPPTLKPGGHA